MTSRYNDTPTFLNNNPLYDSIFEDRGIKSLTQYVSATYKELTEDQKASIVSETLMWEVGDRLDKFASKAYGDAQYWWVIARYNKKPTDAHFQRGDNVLIPRPLSLILSYYTEQ
tara:strand:- start:2074 stop:2415 length:342 start_codon:yes stop_codon:yes gene_type:complete